MTKMRLTFEFQWTEESAITGRTEFGALNIVGGLSYAMCNF